MKKNLVFAAFLLPFSVSLCSGSTESLSGTYANQKMNTILLQSASSKSSAFSRDVSSALPLVDRLLDMVMTTGQYSQMEPYGIPTGIEGNWLRAWPQNAPKNVPLRLYSAGSWGSEAKNEFQFTANLCSPVSHTCIRCKSKYVKRGSQWFIKGVYFFGNNS